MMNVVCVVGFSFIELIENGMIRLEIKKKSVILNVLS